MRKPGLLRIEVVATFPVAALIGFDLAAQERGDVRRAAAEVEAVLELPAQQPPGSPVGGSSTAGVCAVKDARRRPITAGGFVDGAPVVFEDSTTAPASTRSVIDQAPRKRRTSSKSRRRGSASSTSTTTGGSTCIWSMVRRVRRASKRLAAALFRNNHDLTFTDVTARAGVANERWGFGVAAGDFDNDGWVDLYVTNRGPNRLYRNNHDGTFTDVAERMGVTAGGWSTGASFGDFDRDGRLDLFVAGYVDIDPDRPTPPGAQCAYRGEPVLCGPRGLRGAPDWLFRNEGDRFADVSADAGVRDAAGYYGFAAAWVDVDDDADLDLMVVNDSTPNYLYRNTGNGKFEEVGFPSGFAVNEEGREQAGMGLAIGDYDNDGRVDTYITNFSDDSNTLRHNLADGVFADVTGAAPPACADDAISGLGDRIPRFRQRRLAGFFVANGHVYPQVDHFDWGMTWAQRPLLFRNRGAAGSTRCRRRQDPDWPP